MGCTIIQYCTEVTVATFTFHWVDERSAVRGATRGRGGARFWGPY